MNGVSCRNGTSGKSTHTLFAEAVPRDTVLLHGIGGRRRSNEKGGDRMK